MAFLSKVGSVLKHSVSKQIVSQNSASNPSIYQTLRCMSSSKLFIGGLSYTVDDSSLRETFSQYGEVVDARVIVDREENRSKGFGFVTFASNEEASSAIQAMDGQNLQGRRLKVNYVVDKAPRPYSGGGGYSGSNSGGNGGDYASGGSSQEVATGVGRGGSVGSNVTADTGFASDRVEGGSGLVHSATDQFENGFPGRVSNDAGDFEPSGTSEANFGDDETDGFIKRAYSRQT